MSLAVGGPTPTVLIVDEDARLLERFAAGLSARVPGVTVLTASRRADALRILDAEQIDVLVSDEPASASGQGLLAHVSRAKPELTFLALGGHAANGGPREGAAGKPVAVEVLAERVRQAVNGAASGQVRGFSLPTLMHLVQVEHKTCTLEIRESDRTAFLYFQQGQLMDAEAEGQQGTEALAAVALWPAGEMHIHGSCSRRDQRITERPEEVLLRAWVAWDEDHRDPESESLEDLVEDAAGGRTAGKGERTMNRLETVLSELRDQVPEFVATDLVNLESGLSIGGSSADPSFDASAASASYGEVVRANLRALELLGMDATFTEDILITTTRVNILLRMLGRNYYHCLAIGKKGSLGFARAVMKKFEPPLLAALGDVDSQA
jgi:predicted regulator of Ras-like GTPase activity (Roadblock/LC7/MglB family)/DNA-binding response OmpR family regulator